MRFTEMLLGLLMLLVSACSPIIVPRADPTTTTTPKPVTPNTITPTVTMLVATNSPVATDTPAPTVVVTPTDLPYTACGWVWATQDLPQVSAQLSALFQDAGMPEVTASASAYGENCLDQSGKINHFAAMETDFRLVVPVQDTKDTVALGNWITKLLPVIGKVPKEQLPGPNPGQVSIQFKGTGDVVNLTFPRAKGEDLLQQGQSGSALYEALKNNA